VVSLPEASERASSKLGAESGLARKDRGVVSYIQDNDCSIRSMYAKTVEALQSGPAPIGAKSGLGTGRSDMVSSALCFN
jgi:hypothetical protein